ncbi:hypothetical protein AC249_AIPGENE11490 [Exaiptasia diaphana]|nr:hypothetical protein AC249_AIPGENE11490 [Exaiptasia diaphana]
MNSNNRNLMYVFSLQFNNLASLITGKEPNKNVSLVAGLMSLLHALVNPILYGKMSQRYRRGYLQVLKTIRMLCGGEQPVSLNKESLTALWRIQKADKLQVLSTGDNLGFSSENKELCTRHGTAQDEITDDNALQSEVKCILDDIIVRIVKTDEN